MFSRKYFPWFASGVYPGISLGATQNNPSSISQACLIRIQPRMQTESNPCTPLTKLINQQNITQ